MQRALAALVYVVYGLIAASDSSHLFLVHSLAGF
jgi:hypothetical protein